MWSALKKASILHCILQSLSRLLLKMKLNNNNFLFFFKLKIKSSEARTSVIALQTTSNKKVSPLVWSRTRQRHFVILFHLCSLTFFPSEASFVSLFFSVSKPVCCISVDWQEVSLCISSAYDLDCTIKLRKNPLITSCWEKEQFAHTTLWRLLMFMLTDGLRTWRTQLECHVSPCPSAKPRCTLWMFLSFLFDSLNFSICTSKKSFSVFL